jgi:hypothetical protein
LLDLLRLVDLVGRQLAHVAKPPLRAPGTTTAALCRRPRT